MLKKIFLSTLIAFATFGTLAISEATSADYGNEYRTENFCCSNYYNSHRNYDNNDDCCDYGGGYCCR